VGVFVDPWMVTVSFESIPAVARSTAVWHIADVTPLGVAGSRMSAASPASIAETEASVGWELPHAVGTTETNAMKQAQMRDAMPHVRCAAQHAPCGPAGFRSASQATNAGL
jgi:hypothetical protein